MMNHILICNVNDKNYILYKYLHFKNKIIYKMMGVIIIFIYCLAGGGGFDAFNALNIIRC